MSRLAFPFATSTHRARPLTNGLYKVTDNGKPTLLVALAVTCASYGQFTGTDKEQ